MKLLTSLIEIYLHWQNQRAFNTKKMRVVDLHSAGLVLQKSQIGPYNTERLLLFLDELHHNWCQKQNRWEET